MDNFCLNELSENSLKNNMCAIGKALIRAKKSLSLEECKLLMMALTQIKWTDENNDLTIRLSKKEIVEIMNWKITSKDWSKQVRALGSRLSHHSYIEIDGKDKETWNDGYLVVGTPSAQRGYMYVIFNNQFRPLLENLTKNKDFVTLWANDIYKFRSMFSYLLYQELRMHCDTRKTNWRDYTTQQLKNIFQISNDSYMRNNKNKFDRYKFEEKVLDVAIEEINKGEMIKILPFSDMEALKKRKRNKLYKKIKENGYVKKYRFKFIVKNHIKIQNSSEEEILEI